MYLRNANAAIVVYDVTVKHTFDRAKAWINQIKVYFPHQYLIEK